MPRPKEPKHFHPNGSGGTYEVGNRLHAIITIDGVKTSRYFGNRCA